jgi:hypothetical protein
MLSIGSKKCLEKWTQLRYTISKCLNHFLTDSRILITYNLFTSPIKFPIHLMNKSLSIQLFSPDLLSLLEILDTNFLIFISSKLLLFLHLFNYRYYSFTIYQGSFYSKEKMKLIMRRILIGFLEILKNNL